MYEPGQRSSSRDDRGYHDRERGRRSPPSRRWDDRDGDYRRSRKDPPGPPPRDLNYDDEDDQDNHRAPRDDYYRNDGAYPRGSSGLHHAAPGPGPGADGLPGVGPHHAPSSRAPRGRGGFGGLDLPDGPDGFSETPSFSRAAAPQDAHGRGRRGQPSHFDLGQARSHMAPYRDAGSQHHGHPVDRRLSGSGKAVILEGLPEDATEDDILYGLDYVTRDRHFSDDQVRVARFRYDHNDRRIAFVEFHRRSDAEYFLDRYYPDISFPLEHSRGRNSEPITVRVSSPRDRDEMGSSRPRRDDDGWDCIKCGVLNYPHRAVCFKCKSERPDDDAYGASGPLLTGETDECPQQTPSQYVVVRDLEASVTEEVLAKGVMKLFVENSEPAKEAPATANKLKSTAPTNSTVGLGAKPGSLRRVFLMRDRRTNDSWKYGFAEFATVEDAKAAVAKFRASTKFTIASKPVVVAFIHTGVFVPALDPAENPEFSFTPIYNPAVRIKYWDDRAYPSVHVVSVDPASAAPSSDTPAGSDDGNKAGARPSKKVRKEKEPATGSKIAMIPQVQLWAKASAQLHGAKPGADVDAHSAERPEPLNPTDASVPLEADATQPDGPVAAQWGDRYPSYADWDNMACLACGWEAPTEEAIKARGWPQTRGDLLIEHEGRAHNLYKDAEVKKKAAAALAALGKEPRTIVRRTPRLKSDALPVYKSYADFDALRCVLCKRRFKEARLIWLHEQQSELHRRMLADLENRKRAVDEFKAMGKKMYILEPEAGFKKAWEMQRKGVIKSAVPSQQYRDRAQERRHAFGQPKQPSASANAAAAGPPAGGISIAVPEKRKEPAAEPEDSPAAKKAKSSKGAGMLAKMGWTAGAGLGAEGAGRTEAIAAEAYIPGVGLGAEGGKLGNAAEEAARMTRGGFAGFVEKTKERARERFEKM